MIRSSYAIFLVCGVLQVGCSAEPSRYSDAFYEGIRPASQTILFARPLGNQELRSFYSGDPTLKIEWVDGTSGQLKFGSDGNVQLSTSGKSWIGQWQVVDRALCTQFGDMREVRCFRQYSDGELYDTHTGSRHGVVTRS